MTTLIAIYVAGVITSYALNRKLTIEQDKLVKYDGFTIRANIICSLFSWIYLIIFASTLMKHKERG